MFATYQVQLLIYFMLKFAMEILLSESSVVTTFYFNWTTSTVAIFLAVLGLTVLPVNVIVGSYVTNLFQDRYLLLPNLEKPLAIALLFLERVFMFTLIVILIISTYFSCSTTTEGKFLWPLKSWC
jgi:hypothetical protein